MDELDLSIRDVAVGGDGIAAADDGRIVFVRGALPGERVVARVRSEKKRFLHADVLHVVDASADRVAPPCPHVESGCGGCDWQHATVDAQRRHKIRLAEESLRRLAGIEHGIECGPDLSVRHHRTTIRCHPDSDGRLSFRTARSHRLVAVDSCLVAHPALEEVLRDARFPGAGETTLRVSASTGERVAIVKRNSAGIRVPDGVRVGTAGARDVSITERVGSREFRISARSFFQTRPDGAAALAQAVERGVGARWGSGTLVDLYGGVGLFPSLLGDGMDVHLVESNRSACADAQHNLRDRTAVVVSAPVERWRPVPADVVIADPPRTGLGADGVTAIEATGTPVAVVVHCDAASFGRDIGLLDAAGYELRTSELIDLFPHTSHVELVSTLEIK